MNTFATLMNMLRTLAAIEIRAINSKDYTMQAKIEKLTYRIEHKMETLQ